MGCGASTPCTDKEGSGSSESARRSPIVARRFDLDIRRFTRTFHKRSDSTVSDKLLDDDTDDGSSSPTVIKGDQSSDHANNHVSVIESHDQVRQRPGEDEVIEEEEEKEGSVIAPGSPSFRDYCIDDAILSPTSSSKSNGEENEINASHERKERIIEGSSVELAKSEQIKGRRFKIVLLPKGGQVTVKSILNATSSCYNPPCSTAHEKTQLTSHKVQPASAISA